ncbi:hypothetical protein EF918_33830, partial [Streptomyces sp. WAC06614]
MNLDAPGLSSTYGLTGNGFVGAAIGATAGHRGDGVDAIERELAGRPESFFGAGRAFTVEGRTGAQWYDVTVRITRAPDDRPPAFLPPDALPATADPAHAALEDPEGKDTKLDVHHTTAAAAAGTGGGSAGKGLGGLGFGLAPVAPGVWLGGAATGTVQPWQSSQESRHQRTVAEPRVLRSDQGTVEVQRRVRYVVRVKETGTVDAQILQGAGTLTQRVPVEHLVPTTGGVPGPRRRLTPAVVRAVSLADSLAPLAVTSTAAPHQGGGGLFDTVASVLHPAVTEPGAPGRARLYEATSTATLLEDLPRLLREGVVGEDLYARDGRTVGSYHLRATLTRLAPAWSTGRTQLRTHQQSQTSVTQSAAKGRALQGGAGPAIGVGAAGNAAVVRATAMPLLGARKARFTVTEQTASSRQGAEIRGEKALYVGEVTIVAQGMGAPTPVMLARPGRRVARTSMAVWVSLRADEAKELGLPLPTGMQAGPLARKPTTADAHGNEVDVERHLPFGGKGANVALGRLDTEPLVRAVRRLFTTDPRLAGYLPDLGDTPPATDITGEEAEVRRSNYRALLTALSETHLRVDKDQLLSTGIRVRLRRKSALHAHDVQLLVKGQLTRPTYQGDIADWSVRSHAGVAGNAQSGRSSSRSAGGLVLGQARVVPGFLTAAARYERQHVGARRNQAGPTSRTDVVSNGSDAASAFAASLAVDVDVTLTSRRRKLARSVTVGAPGRDVPQAEHLATLHLGAQEVRLLTPAEFTVDGAAKARIDATATARRARPTPPDQPFHAAGIGDLATVTPRAALGGVLRDWQLVETVDGEPVRALAFELLSRAAARNQNLRTDPALATEGLAPRQAIEERFGERAVQGALRQAASSGWVVKNLTYPRRLRGLDGAVGTRLTLTNPRYLHKAAGPGTETFVLGGHQAGGQTGEGPTSTVQYGFTVSERGDALRAGQGLSTFHTSSETDAHALTLGGTVERNAHTPKKAPLYLVQCDLLVHMVAEVKITATRHPYVTSGVRTLPAAAAVWLTEAQLPTRLRTQLRLDTAATPPTTAPSTP